MAIREHNNYLSRFLNQITNLPVGQQVVLFGCGQRGESALKYLQSAECRIVCLTDNAEDLWNTEKWEYRVLDPKVAVQTYGDAFYVIANKLNSKDIAEQLFEMGIAGEMICKY